MTTYDFTAPIGWSETYNGEHDKRASVRVRDQDGWIASIHRHLLQAEQDVTRFAEREEAGYVVPENRRQEIIRSYEHLKQEIQELFDILKTKEAKKPVVGDKQLNILLASQQFSTCLWTSLASTDDQEERDIADRTLMERNRVIALETRECFNQKGKTRRGPEEGTRNDPEKGKRLSLESSSSGFSDEATPWLKELLDKLSTKPEAKPPSMKLPETYDGSDVSKFRSWWRSVTRYMRVYASTMRKDEIKITWIGALLRGEALNWYHAREGRHETNGTQDEWEAFRKALEERFKDTLEKRKDESTMRKLRYSGSISNYLAQIDEYNGRVGMTGITFRNMIIEAMPEKIIDMVFNRAGGIPDDDETLLETIKIAGQIVEENQRIKNSIHGQGTKRKVPTNNSDPPAKKPKTNREQVWKSFEDAFKGIPQSELNEYRDSEGCRRCGKNGHRALFCFAKRSAKGTELPTAPGNHHAQVNNVVSGQEPETEVTSAIVAGVINSQEDILDHTRIWEIDSSEEEQDF